MSRKKSKIAPIKFFKSKITWAAVFLFLLAIFSWHQFHRSIFPQYSLITTQQEGALNQCSQKNYCLIAVLAPWCSISRVTIPVIQDLEKKWKNSNTIGIRILVTRAKEDFKQKFSQELGPISVVDPGNQIYSELRFRAYPSWFLVDRSGKILKTYRGGLGRDKLNEFEDDLLQRLGIKQILIDSQ